MKNVVFESVKLQNFRCYEEMEFSFVPNRFVMVTGPNGSGKSTLVADSICYALYDMTAKGKKGDSILRKRNPKDCSVIFKFSIDENQYEIRNYRKHKEFGDEKILLLNGKDITETTRKQTNEKIINILMPPDVFLNCLLFSQYVGKSITTLAQGGQRDILDKMLGFEKYDVYQKSYKDERDKNSSLIEQFSSMILLQETNVNNVGFILENEEHRKEELDERHKVKMRGLQEEISKLLEKQMKNVPKISEIEKVNKEREQVQYELMTLGNREEQLIEKKNEELTRLTEKLKIEESLKIEELKLSNEKNLHERETSLVNKNNEFSTIKNKISTENTNLKNKYLIEKEKINSGYKEPLESLSNKISELGIYSQKCSTEKSSHQKSLKKLLDDIHDMQVKIDYENPICYACGQEIKDTSLDRIKKKLEEKKKEYQIEINEISKYNQLVESTKLKITECEKAKDALDNKLNLELKNLEEQKSKKVEELKNDYETCIAVFGKEIKIIERKVEEVKNFLQSKIAEVKVEFEEKKRDNSIKITDKYNEQISVLNEEHKKKNVIFEQVLEKLKELTSLKKEIEDNKVWIESKEEELSLLKKNYNRDLEEMNLNIKKIEQSKIESSTKLSDLIQSNNECVQRSNIISFWNTAFSDSGIRSILLDESIPILNTKAKELSALTDTIRVKFDSQKSLKSGDMRNKFSINCIQIKNLTDDRDDFSAGEGRIVDLICLMSFRYLLERMHDTSFNVLLLDEILDALDPDNVQVVLNMIRKMSDEHCVVLISHTLRDWVECDEHLTL